MDFRDQDMVEESAGNVTLCMYICDGGLKRNASFTFATQEITALCELHMYCTVLCVVTTSSCILLVYVRAQKTSTYPFLPSLDTVNNNKSSCTLYVVAKTVGQIAVLN